MKPRRRLLLALAFSWLSVPSLAQERGDAPADLAGVWVGTLYQDSHDTTGSFRMILTIRKGYGAEFSGTLDWPDSNNCRTAVEGSFDGRTLKFTETEYLIGDDVVLGGLYIATFKSRDRITGSWMDPKHTIYPKGPNYGTPGAWFVLQKKATKT